MSRSNTPGSQAGHLSIAGALELVRNNEEGPIPARAISVLERSMTEIWRRIQAQPSTYLLTKDEFSVLNYYRDRYKDYPQAQEAIARFWQHFRGDAAQVNGVRPS